MHPPPAAVAIHPVALLREHVLLHIVDELAITAVLSFGVFQSTGVTQENVALEDSISPALPPERRPPRLTVDTGRNATIAKL